MKKSISIFLSLLLGVTCMTGCGKDPAKEAARIAAEQEATHLIELNQNDYRGGITRIEEIRTSINNLMMSYKEKNDAVVSERGTDYWNSEDFMYFTNNLISDKAYLYTDVFNETETTWEDAEALTKDTMIASGEVNEEGIIIERLEENVYRLKYTQNHATEPYLERERQVVDRDISCTFDANHDWVSAVMKSKPRDSDTKEYTDGLMEYARIGNTFVIQTQNERLLITFSEPRKEIIETTTKDKDGNETVTTEEVAVDTGNYFADRDIVSLYYSRLNGKVLPYYVLAQETDWEDGLWGESYGIVDDLTSPDGEIAYQYNANKDSIFTNLEAANNKDWVFRDGYAYYDQTVVYENGNLEIKDYNKLNNMFEVFTYYADGATDFYSEKAPDEFSPYNDIDLTALRGRTTHATLVLSGVENDIKLTSRHNADFLFGDLIHGNKINNELLGVDGAAWHGHIVYETTDVNDYGSDYSGNYEIYGNMLEQTNFNLKPSATNQYTTPTYKMDYGDIFQSAECRTSNDITFTRLGESRDNPAISLKNVAENDTFTITFEPTSDELRDALNFRTFTLTAKVYQNSEVYVTMKDGKIYIDSSGTMSNVDVTYNGQMPHLETHEEEYEDEDGKPATREVSETVYENVTLTENYIDVKSLVFDFNDIFSIHEEEAEEVDEEPTPTTRK